MAAVDQATAAALLVSLSPPTTRRCGCSPYPYLAPWPPTGSPVT